MSRLRKSDVMTDLIRRTTTHTKVDVFDLAFDDQANLVGFWTVDSQFIKLNKLESAQVVKELDNEGKSV